MSEISIPTATLRSAETLRLMGQYDRALRAFDDIILDMKKKRISNEKYKNYKQELVQSLESGKVTQVLRDLLKGIGVNIEEGYKVVWIPEKGLKADKLSDNYKDGTWVLVTSSKASLGTEAKPAYCLDVSHTKVSIYQPNNRFAWAVAHRGGTYLGSAIQKTVQNNTPDEELEKARKDLQLAVTIRPGHGWAWAKLGEVWRTKANEFGARAIRMKNYREALSCFDTAIDCDSNDIQARAHKVATFVNARFFAWEAPEQVSNNFNEALKEINFVNKLMREGYPWFLAYRAAFDFIKASETMQDSLSDDQRIKKDKKEKHYLLTISNLLNAMTMEPKLLEHPIEPGERHNNVFLAFGNLLLDMNLPDLAFEYCDQAEQINEEDPIRDLRGLTAVRIHVLRAQCLDVAQTKGVSIRDYNSTELKRRLSKEVAEANKSIENVLGTVIHNYHSRNAVIKAEQDNKEGLDAGLQEVRIYLGMIRELSSKTKSEPILPSPNPPVKVVDKEFEKKIVSINNLLDKNDRELIEKEEAKREQPQSSAEISPRFLFNYLYVGKSLSQIVKALGSDLPGKST